jgi:hypothetical protein
MKFYYRTKHTHHFSVMIHHFKILSSLKQLNVFRWTMSLILESNFHIKVRIKFFEFE